MQTKHWYNGSNVIEWKQTLSGIILFIVNNKERFQIKISNETNTNIKYEKLLVFKINHVLSLLSQE